MKPDISVIIPTYNSAETIAACISSLRNQDFRGPYEILVVDCSRDSTPDIVKGFKGVKLISLPKRVFPGEARNEGIKKAKGGIIAFTDSDCIAGRGWLSTIKKNVPLSPVVGGAVDNSSRNLISWADHFLSFSEFLPGVKRRWKGFVPTCNVAYRKEIFKRFGFFPPDRRASEDVFFNTFVSKKERILFDPDMMISHRSRQRLGDYLRHQYLLGANAAEVRMQRPDIYGSFLVRSVLFGLLLPFIRGARITRRVFAAGRSLAYLYIATLPLLMMGLLAWSFGFSFAVARREHEV